MPNHAYVTLPRKSERVLLRIPILVEGKDAYGRAFDETSHTLVVNRSGGLIMLSHTLEPGSIIKITNLRTHVSCSFEVVTRTERSLTGTAEWGVKCLDPELGIWGVHFPAAVEGAPPANAIHVLLECQVCFSREMAMITAQEYRKLAEESSLPRACPQCNATRNWQCAFIESEADEVLPSLPAPSAPVATARRGIENRRDKRLAIKLPLGVRLPNGAEEDSTTENISKSGLCFACNLEMQVGDRVYVTVRTDIPGEEQDVPARVMWRRPAKEKGRAYYGVSLKAG
jgi:hypothetical protein